LKLIETHTVPELDTPQRLSDYAVGVFLKLSTKKGIKKAISKGLIKVDERRGTTGKFIKGGEVITLHEGKNNKPTIDLPLEIIFEDDFLAVVNKPAGMIVSGNQKRTLENALPSNLEKSKQADKLQRALPVHRLDHSTSGLILIAKTRAAQTKLSQMFGDRKIKKTYNAITIGKSEEQGEIDSSIKDKKALTHFRKIQSIESEKYGHLNLMELNPHTGRRHQLRIHMFENGTPILGDKRYFVKGKISQGSGLYLCSTGLSFTHPITENPINLNLELPKKFVKIFGGNALEEE